MTKYEIYEYSGTAGYDFADRDYEYLANKFGEIGGCRLESEFNSLGEAKKEWEGAPHYYRTSVFEDREVRFYSINKTEYDESGDLIQGEVILWSKD